MLDIKSLGSVGKVDFKGKIVTPDFQFLGEQDTEFNFSGVMSGLTSAAPNVASVKVATKGTVNFGGNVTSKLMEIAASKTVADGSIVVETLMLNANDVTFSERVSADTIRLSGNELRFSGKLVAKKHFAVVAPNLTLLSASNLSSGGNLVLSSKTFTQDNGSVLRAAGNITIASDNGGSDIGSKIDLQGIIASKSLDISGNSADGVFLGGEITANRPEDQASHNVTVTNSLSGKVLVGGKISTGSLLVRGADVELSGEASVKNVMRTVAGAITLRNGGNIKSDNAVYLEGSKVIQESDSRISASTEFITVAPNASSNVELKGQILTSRFVAEMAKDTRFNFAGILAGPRATSLSVGSVKINSQGNVIFSGKVSSETVDVSSRDLLVSGALSAKKSLSVTAPNIKLSETADLLASDALVLSAGNLTLDQGGVMQSGNSIKIYSNNNTSTSAGRINLNGSIITKDLTFDSNKASKLNLGGDLSGVIGYAPLVKIYTKGDVKFSGDIKAKRLDIQSGNFSSNGSLNAETLILSGDNLEFGGGVSGNQLSLSGKDFQMSGGMSAVDRVTINARNLKLSSTSKVQAGNSLTLSVDSLAQDSGGVMQAGGSLRIQAASYYSDVTLNGNLSAKDFYFTDGNVGDTYLVPTKALRFGGTLRGADGVSAARSVTFDTRSNIHIGGDISSSSVDLTGVEINLNGRVAANGRLTLYAANNLNIKSGARIYAKDDINSYAGSGASIYNRVFMHTDKSLMFLSNGSSYVGGALSSFNNVVVVSKKQVNIDYSGVILNIYKFNNKYTKTTGIVAIASGKINHYGLISTTNTVHMDQTTRLHLVGTGIVVSNAANKRMSGNVHITGSVKFGSVKQTVIKPY